MSLATPVERAELTRRCRALLLVLLALGCAGEAAASRVVSVEFVLAARSSAADGIVAEIPGAQRPAVGIEWFETVSGDYGDIVVFDIQARLSHDPHGPGHRGLGLEIHNAWADLRLGLGRAIRAGHFSPAFGLEPDVDTHGKLLQTLAGRDVGFKKDWGLAWRGVAGEADVTASLQLGSGAFIDRRDGSHLASVRFTAPTGENTLVGVSALRGRVLENPDARTLPAPDPSGPAVERSRIGVDLSHEAGGFRLLAELSAGADDRSAAGGLLTRAELQPRGAPRLEIAVQAVLLGRHGRLSSSRTLAASYQATDRWSLSAALVRETGASADDTRLELLAYCFGRIR